MSSFKKFGIPFFVILSLIPLAYLFSVALEFGFYGDWRDAVSTNLVEFTLEMDGTTTEVTLPYIIEDGTAGQTVVLTTELENVNAQRLYFKGVFSAVQVYANDILIYDYGSPGTYPSYFDDPPTMTATVELPNESIINLRVEYSYPSTRDDLILDTMMVGTYPAIFSTLLTEQEPHLFLYLTFLVLGIFLICVGLLIRIIERQGSFFLGWD